ncbi:MAG: glycosyltransferase [Anaerolineae bacterium]|nr:glycosyltransferase [Anaerolineae bacterium]
MKNQKDFCILSVHANDTYGGAARVAVNLHRGYRQRGHAAYMAVGQKLSIDSSIFAFANETLRLKLNRLCGSLGKKLTQAEWLPGRWYPARFLWWLGSVPFRWQNWLGFEDFDYPGAWKLLEQMPHKPAILHAHNLHGGYFDLRALPYLSNRVPLVMTLHDAWMLSGHCAHSFDCQRWKTGCGKCPDLTIPPAIQRDGTAYNWQRKKRILEQSRYYIATPSRWLMQKVEQSILAKGMIASKVIPNGVDISLFHPGDQQKARLHLNIPPEAAVILCASESIRNRAWSDFDLLRGAVQQAAEALQPRQVILLGLGEETPAQPFGRAEVRFVPYLKDETALPLFFQAADVLIHPSRADNFPNVILEALACGLPVLSTRVGGIPEQIEEGKTGFLVEPGDVPSMTENIIRMISDSALRRQMGIRAREIAEERYHLDHQVSAYLNWFESILDRSP